MALMTPGWYQDEEGTWKWWHGDSPHGDPARSCRNYEAKEEKLEDLAEENLEANENQEAQENREAQNVEEP